MSKPINATLALNAADYVIYCDMSVRQAAAILGVPSTTVWWNLNRVLPELDSIKYNKVRKILELHRG